MKDIDGFEDALKVLKPHWKDIEADFEKNNQMFLALAAMDHDAIGRVLRTHLIVEHFLNNFIVDFYALEDFDSLRLTFAQKAKLVPSAGSGAAFVRPGIIQLNSVRNKFGHRLEFRVEGHEVAAIEEVLRHARPGVVFKSPVEAIEAFGPVACAFLTVVPAELRGVFQHAFANLRSHTPYHED